MAAGQTTGDSGAQEVALEVLAEPVLAVQDRVVPPAELRRGPVAHKVFEQPFGLGRLVGERIRAHVVLGLPLGREQRQLRSSTTGCSIVKSSRNRASRRGSAPAQEKIDCSSSPTAKKFPWGLARRFRMSY